MRFELLTSIATVEFPAHLPTLYVPIELFCMPPIPYPFGLNVPPIEPLDHVIPPFNTVVPEPPIFLFKVPDVYNALLFVSVDTPDKFPNVA